MQALKPTTILVLFAVGSVAASSFLFMKILVEEISPSEVVAGRVFFGALALLAVIWLKGESIVPDRGLAAKLLLFSALETVIPFSLIAWAEQEIDSGLAAVLISSMPLFTLLFASITPTDERLSGPGLFGLLLGFVGIIVLSGIDRNVLFDGDLLSRLAVLGAGASYAAAGVFARLQLRTENTLVVSGIQLGFATLLAFPLAFAASGSPSFDLTLGGWASLVTLGVVGSGLMLLGFLWLVERAGSIGASLVTYVVPFVGVFLGWIVLGETVDARTALGLMVVLLGVAVTMLGGQSRDSTRSAPSETPAPALDLLSSSPQIARFDHYGTWGAKADASTKRSGRHPVAR